MSIVLIVSSVFMILLILIQRGKGGGLSGAFGGAGGSSAFGSRAGDTFTRITIYAAAFWVLFIMITSSVRSCSRRLTEKTSRSLPRHQTLAALSDSDQGAAGSSLGVVRWLKTDSSTT